MDGMNNGMNEQQTNSQGIDLGKEQQNNYGQAGYPNQNQYGQTQQQQASYGQTDYSGNQYGQAQQQGQFQNAQQGQFQNTQYGQNGQGFNQYSDQPNGFDTMATMGAGLIGVNAPDYMLWLVLGIVQICTICCCNCTAVITGVITVILVVMANNSYKVGNAVDYQSKIKIAKIVCCIGYGLMIIGWIVSFFFGLFDTMMNMVN